jgi:hypothetical protein
MQLNQLEWKAQSGMVEQTHRCCSWFIHRSLFRRQRRRAALFIESHSQARRRRNQMPKNILILSDGTGQAGGRLAQLCASTGVPTGPNR